MRLAASTYLLASLTLITGPARAESAIENQCRAAMRAELKGPNCKESNVRDASSFADPCGIPKGSNMMIQYAEKVVQCVKRGGPGR